MKTYSNYIQEQEINEGFWSWLGKLFKSLFSDDTTQDTRDYTEKALKRVKDSNPKLNEPTNDLLKDVLKRKGKDFLDDMDKTVKELLDNKTINEEDSIKWQLTVLSIAIRINNDSKNTDVVKILKERFDEIAKKNQDLAKELMKDIKSEKVPENPNNDKSKEKEGKEENQHKKVLEVYKEHIDIIKEICNSDKVKVKYLDIQKEISEYCISEKINDPNIYYSLYLIKLGNAVTNDDNKIKRYVDAIKTKISSKK